MIKSVPHPLSAERGFSLVEIIIAIGIVSFALVGILGLFPVAIDAASNSQRETQAALIARSIFSDLQASTPTNSYLVADDGYNRADFSGMFDPTVTDAKIPVNLRTPNTYVMAYDSDGMTLKPAVTHGAAEFENGIKDAAFAAKVVVSTNTVPNTLPPGVSIVDVTISAPANVKKEHRQNYNFVSYLANGVTNSAAPTP